ncbi:hypothetical protein C8A03DRAFT_13455 [Achaetomium macrosporum]|uniref:Uncharacterized protein n=1 Tax=Achaetomium macrosporum TaxID=79813 RepID=A0AAN7CDZ5_9PEZI|nr:hypothetical protein C8A03DRAFT_13455 [Achaetomium macrosporum]
MSNKAPSAGTKITTGDRPVYREGPGNVPEGSLAAESASMGGAFASNPGQEQGQKRSEQSQPQSSERHQTAHSGTGTQGTAANKTTSLNFENQQSSRGTAEDVSSTAGKQSTDLSLENQQAYGGAAPTYVSNQRYRDPGGPHGKNLTEGGFEGSGTEGGPLPEPGTIDDPTRAAQSNFRSGMASQGRDAGPRQTQGAGEKTWYTPLGGNDEAA